MRNIWNHSKRIDINIGVLISVVALLGILVWSVKGIDTATSTNKEQKKLEVETSIHKAVTLCYSVEGSYPPNINYLVDNYGLVVDTDKYIVHYEIFASNIAPQIKVFDMNSDK